MIKVRHYSSLEEVKDAFKAAIEKKETIYRMLRQGATKEDFDEAGIYFVPISEC